ncbi:peptidylprolyl isomerase [Pelagimonas varians]|uniref:Parvulin-like PPIase n=1 Tax=Pelagimonas varians TaxID=696760 RepID=A0A238KLB0_9RHOB|nr:peptidylprolyl isomerase [Pelagimonas varians]PYG29164.1 peptidyl-prolyl cis-trans isomerase C [Pelagimonas varians]SMX43490.1 putative parvulin-type peptidyl-prolyl cis-trans isomerase precursor [Pelagimonas varians]
MSKTLGFLGAAALAITFALPAQSEELTVDSVMASVNGTDITLGHMLMVRALLPDQYQQLPDDVLWDGILDQLVQQEVLAKGDLANETARVRLALENERRTQMASVALAAMADQAVTEDAVQAAYKAEYMQGEAGLEFNASHILVETEEEAQAIVGELSTGVDFAELAQTKSTGPSGPNGGSLGWFSKGMMVAPFQDAVDTLEAGGIAGPVKTQFGWHVIKLNETRIQEAPALETVREAIETQVRQTVVTKQIEEMVGTADVTRTKPADVDTSILSKLDMLED